MIAALAMVGCAGTQDVIRPNTQSRMPNTKVIDKPRDAIWNAAVPALSKEFFVINNMDRTSGFINVSYTGDPEKYIDCGRVISYVRNARGERTYDFAGSKAEQAYEIMMPQGLFFLQRQMALEGRLNLIFEETSPTQTRVTASTRYVVTRSVTARDVNNRTGRQSNNISFNSGSGASFPMNEQGKALECVSNGRLESEILDLIR